MAKNYINIDNLKSMQKDIFNRILFFSDRSNIERKIYDLNQTMFISNNNTLSVASQHNLLLLASLLSNEAAFQNNLRIIYDCHELISSYIKNESDNYSINSLIYYVTKNSATDVLDYFLKYLIKDDYFSSFFCNNKQKTNYLNYTVAYCNLATIKYIVDKFKCNINNQDENGNTALFYSLFNPKPEVINFLINNCNANIRHINKQEEGFLYLAVKYNKIKPFNNLLDKFTISDLFKKSMIEYYFLSYENLVESVFTDANSKADAEIITTVLDAIVTGKIKNDSIIIFYKIMNDIRNLCQLHKYQDLLAIVEFNSINKAIKDENIEQLKEYYKSGYNFQLEDPKSDQSFLHIAVSEFKDIKIINFLIEDCNLDVNLLNGNGDTPLDIAARSNHGEVAVQLIEKYNAKIRIYNKHNINNNINNLIYFAVEHNDLELTKAIVGRGKTHTDHFQDMENNGNAFCIIDGKQASKELISFLLDAVENGKIKSDVHTENKTSYKCFLIDILNGALYYKDIEIIKIIKKKLQQAKIERDQDDIIYEDVFEKYYINEEELSESEESEIEDDESEEESELDMNEDEVSEEFDFQVNNTNDITKDNLANSNFSSSIYSTSFNDDSIKSIGDRISNMHIDGND